VGLSVAGAWVGEQERKGSLGCAAALRAVTHRPNRALCSNRERGLAAIEGGEYSRTNRPRFDLSSRWDTSFLGSLPR
jgi:hypothetical protein